MKGVVIALCLVVLTNALAPIGESDVEFAKFIKKYNKVYASHEEKLKRYNNFKNSLLRAEELNTEGGATFGITRFADMSPAEFKSTILMKEIIGEVAPEAYLSEMLPSAPLPGLDPVFDWRTKGAVTAVKNQGECGSCWAFSATEALESANILAGKADLSIDLSPQQIVDCDHDLVFGCNGGRTDSAYEYLIKAGGEEGIDHYPYVGANGKCNFNASFVEASLSAYQKDLGKPETSLQTNLVSMGPLSICVDAAHWQLYTSGVLTARQCCPLLCQLDHCVQMVGYNATDPNQPYWIIRNSWTTDWGIDGYIYVEMGTNACGLTSTVTWPTV